MTFPPTSTPILLRHIPLQLDFSATLGPQSDAARGAHWWTSALWELRVIVGHSLLSGACKLPSSFLIFPHLMPSSVRAKWL